MKKSELKELIRECVNEIVNPSVINIGDEALFKNGEKGKIIDIRGLSKKYFRGIKRDIAKDGAFDGFYNRPGDLGYAWVPFKLDDLKSVNGKRVNFITTGGKVGGLKGEISDWIDEITNGELDVDRDYTIGGSHLKKLEDLTK